MLSQNQIGIPIKKIKLIFSGLFPDEKMRVLLSCCLSIAQFHQTQNPDVDRVLPFSAFFFPLPAAAVTQYFE